MIEAMQIVARELVNSLGKILSFCSVHAQHLTHDMAINMLYCIIKVITAVAAIINNSRSLPDFLRLSNRERLLTAGSNRESVCSSEQLQI